MTSTPMDKQQAARVAFYYVQDKSRGYLGNSPTWWALDDKGYTAYLTGAKRFTYDEAVKVTSAADDLVMYPCSEIDKRLHLVFDAQDFGRLGTDEPCGWRWGYAPQAAQAALMPALVEAREAVEASQAMRKHFMRYDCNDVDAREKDDDVLERARKANKQALARINALIGDKK